MPGENKNTNENLGGWAIAPELLAHAKKMVLPVIGTILELGAGTGTLELRKFCHVISIEQDEKYMPPLADGHMNIYMPLDKNTGWYDRAGMKNVLEHLHYQLIIVDGPSRYGRHGFMHNLDLFDRNAGIIVDDLQRQEIKIMCAILSRHLGRPYEERRAGPRNWFAVFPKVGQKK